MSHPYLKFSIALSILMTLTLHSPLTARTDPVPPPEKKKEPTSPPWFTGPLLTPSGHVIPFGHYNIEPYVYATTDYGTYNADWNTRSTSKFYNVNSSTLMQFGLPWNFDFGFAPSFSWNHTTGASHWALNDMPFGFDYQLWEYKKGDFWPATKLIMGANLPIGKYQKLNPKRKGTDAEGTGTWAPGIGIGMSHLFWWGGHIFFSPRLNVQYLFPTSVHVKGYNVYGGGHGTSGKVYPGQTISALFGFEISLSQRWAIAGDVKYFRHNRTGFKGRKGSTDGVTNQIGGPSSEAFSVAPAIEYSWSYNYGIVAGAWFSVGGRNAVEFASGVVALNIYH